MEYLSASKLKRFRSCPFQFKNEPFKKTPAMDFGTAIHAAIAEWAIGNNPIDGYKQIAKKLNIDPGKENHAIELINKVIDSERLQLNRDYIVTVESGDGEIVLYDKPYFQIDVIPQLWGLRGSMDYVDIRETGELRIIDWKTGMSEEEDDLQLACYALAAYKKYPGFNRIETGFFYLERGVYQSSIWTPEDLTGALEYVDKLARQFLSETIFPQKPHKWCRYCTLKDTCKAFQALIEKEPTPVELEERLDLLPSIISDLEKAENIVKAAEAIVEDLKQKRNNLLMTHGPQILDGRQFKANVYTSTYDYNIPEIFSVLSEKLGRPPFEILKLNSSGLDELKKTLDKQDKKDLETSIKLLRSVKTQAVRVIKSISKDSSETDSEEAA